MQLWGTCSGMPCFHFVCGVWNGPPNFAGAASSGDLGHPRRAYFGAGAPPFLLLLAPSVAEFVVVDHLTALLLAGACLALAAGF